MGRLLTRDRARETPGLVRIRKLEEHYAKELRKIARQVGLIVKGWAGDGNEIDLGSVPALRLQLEKYSHVIRPWAEATAGRLIEEIAIRERRAWAEHAKAMSRAMREELRNAPTGHALRGFLNDQVRLITSLPTDAGERVHHLTLRGLEDATRAREVAREILRTGDVTVSRANLIARTEVARTASGLTMARAQHVGSTGYVWRTSRDGDVRPSHKAMEGRFVAWDAPPVLDSLRGHAGQLPNCRCYPEPVLPEID